MTDRVTINPGDARKAELERLAGVDLCALLDASQGKTVRVISASPHLVDERTHRARFTIQNDGPMTNNTRGTLAEDRVTLGVTPSASDGKVSLHELYAGGLPCGAIDDLQPNTLLLLPLRAPATSTGGIITTTDERGTLGTNCLAYVVVGVGVEVASGSDHDPRLWVPVKPGDVVVVRTAMLEPLHIDLEPLAIHRRHVLSTIRIRDLA